MKRKYNEEWEEKPEFKGWLTKSRMSEHAWCKLCKSEIRIHASDLKRHVNRACHQKAVQAQKMQPAAVQATPDFVITQSMKRRRLELKLAISGVISDCEGHLLHDTNIRGFINQKCKRSSIASYMGMVSNR